MNMEIVNESSIRLDLNNHFLELINLVDIDTEELIMNINKKESLTETDKFVAIGELNRKRNDKINKIKEIEAFNLDQLEKYEIGYNLIEDKSENQSKNSKRDLVLKKSCIYFDNKLLKNYLNSDKIDGLLVVFDYCLSTKDLNLFRGCMKLLDLYEINQNNTITLEEYFICDQLVRSINNKESIIHINLDQIKTIEEMMICNRSESNTLNIVSLENERFRNIKTLKISMNGGTFNSILHAHIQSLSICNAKLSKLSKLPNSFHWNLKNLKKLQLVNLEFGGRIKNIFDELVSLEELEISYDEFNQYTRISLKHNPLVNCKSLRKIDLEVGDTDELDENAFQGLTNLETLSINLIDYWFIDGGISKIIRNMIKPLSNLETFKLDYGTGSIDPDEMNNYYSKSLSAKYTEFQMLSFSSFKWKKVDIVLENSKNIEKLLNELIHLEEIQITYFSERFKNLIIKFKIQKKHSTWKLTEFDASFEDGVQDDRLLLFSEHKLENLAQLIYSDIDSKIIPSLTDLSCVETLCFYMISFNKSVLNNLNSLKKLVLLNVQFSGENPEQVLKELLINMTRLEHLEINQSEIEDLKESLFDNLSRLKILKLTENRIASLEKNVFAKLTNLQHLDLSYNMLTETEIDSAFYFLFNLKSLNLCCNDIEHISKDFFRGLKCLEKLSLSNNQIKIIDLAEFLNLPSLAEIDFSSNDFKEISNPQLYKYLVNNKRVTINGIKKELLV